MKLKSITNLTQRQSRPHTFEPRYYEPQPEIFCTDLVDNLQIIEQFHDRKRQTFDEFDA